MLESTHWLKKVSNIVLIYSGTVLLAIAFAKIFLCYVSEFSGLSIVSNVVLIYSSTLFLSSMTQIAGV